MLYVISHCYTGEVLAETEAENALEALSNYSSEQGFARPDEMSGEDIEELLGYHPMHGGRFATIAFTNYEILAAPAEELN